MAHPGPLLSAEDVDRIVASTFVECVEYHPALPSTNDRALQLSQGRFDRIPALVVVDEQTAGRGRGSNRWWSSHGALTFSLLLDASAIGLRPADWPKTSLAAGLAVCDAVDGLLGGRRLNLKWPNDVLADGRKLCGILAEVPPHRKDLLVLGIGVNVNNRSAGAPTGLSDSAISMCELAGRPFSLCDVLMALLEQLSEKLHWISDGQVELQEQWKRRCMLTGRTVRLELPDRCLWGVCQGIDRDGALLLQTTTGSARCLSGVVCGWE